MSTTIVKSILYGNTAKRFASKRDSDGHTHQWRIYVRSFNGEDLSKFISRIQFRLHETYPNNVRIVHQPPFEIEETGWGEFDVQITIFFVDINEKPVVFYHHLKLFSTEADVITGKSIFVNEFYDELVFQDPSEFLLELLQNSSILSLNSDAADDETIENRYTRQKIETIEKIRQTRQQIRSEIQQLSERFRITQENLQRLRQISDPNDRHDVEHRTS